MKLFYGILTIDFRGLRNFVQDLPAGVNEIFYK